MIQDLLSLCGGLLRDSVANLSRGIENRATVADLRKPAKSADGGSGGERHQVSVVYLRGEAGRADLVEADVFGKFDGEPIRAGGAVEGDKHLSLLGIAHRLHIAEQPRTLRQ